MAVEYLSREKQSFVDGLEPLLGRARDPGDFVRRWCRLLRKQVRIGQFYGCKVSRLLQTLETVPDPLQIQSAAIIEFWIERMTTYFTAESEAGRFSGDPARTAEKFIRLFQGTAAMYRLHGKSEVFLFLEDDLLLAVGGSSLRTGSFLSHSRPDHLGRIT